MRVNSLNIQIWWGVIYPILYLHNRVQIISQENENWKKWTVFNSIILKDPTRDERHTKACLIYKFKSRKYAVITYNIEWIYDALPHDWNPLCSSLHVKQKGINRLWNRAGLTFVMWQILLPNGFFNFEVNSGKIFSYTRSILDFWYKTLHSHCV